MKQLAWMVVAAAGCSSVQAAPAPCELRWAELDADNPAVVAIAEWPADGDTNLPDECPTDFAPAKLLATKHPAKCKAPDCYRGPLATGIPAALVVDGPSGSGRFEALGLAVGGSTTPHYACMLASTAGWRQLSDKAHKALAPLTWFADLDADGTTELVKWSRLSFGDAESENGLVPVAYHFDGNRLIRNDALAAKLAKRVAPYFRTSLNDGQNTTCRTAIADALDHWGQPRP